MGAISLLLGAYGLEPAADRLCRAWRSCSFGLGLMIAEAFVPSFGAFVLGGSAAFLIGSLMMFRDRRACSCRSRLIVGATLVASRCSAWCWAR